MNFGRAFNHEIVIQPSSNYGFVVRVGCGLFVYKDKQSMLNDIEKYLESPKEVEKEYNESCATHVQSNDQIGGAIPSTDSSNEGHTTNPESTQEPYDPF